MDTTQSQTPRTDAARGDTALGRLGRYGALARDLERENAELRAALVTALGALDAVAGIEPDCGHNSEINLANRAIAQIGNTGAITWREVKDARAALGAA